MGEIKGTAVASTLKYITENYSSDGLKTILDNLTDTKDKEIFSSTIFPSSWYPIQSFSNLCKSIKQAFGKKDPNILRKIGRYSAEQGLTTIYKLFYRFGSPQFIISKASIIWGRYYTSGKLEVVSSDKTSAIVHLIDFDLPSIEICERVMGWMEGSLALSGGKNISIKETLCKARGDAYCRFEAKWEI